VRYYYFPVLPKITILGEELVEGNCITEKVKGYRIRMQIYPPVGSNHVVVEGAFPPEVATNQTQLSLAFGAFGRAIFEKIRLERVK